MKRTLFVGNFTRINLSRDFFSCITPSYTNNHKNKSNSQFRNLPIIIGVVIEKNYNECMKSNYYIVNFIVIKIMVYIN